VDRHFYIQNFVQEDYWKISVTYKKDDAQVSFLWKRGRLFDQMCCAILCQECLDAGQAVVTNASGRERTKSYG
jgi:DNA topoisomerase-3